MDSVQEHGVNKLFQAQCHIYKHMYHYIESMALKCAVQLGIPDVIHNHHEPISLLDLISALDVPATKANSLQRLMRILIHAGFFDTAKLFHGSQEEEDEGYVLTNSSKLLLKDSPTSLRLAVLGILDPALINPLFSLGDWLKGSQATPFEIHHGMTFWDYAKQNNEFFHSLNEAMASDSQLASLVVEGHKEIFEKVNSVVDLGGGTGTLARTIANAFPHMKCTVLDLPQVVANLPHSKNLRFVGGDMFQSIPSADAIVIKSVLHNWSDEDCVKILKNCREAIPSKAEGGKLILVEMVISRKKDLQEQVRLFVDMEMTLLCNGKGRNEKEWKKIFLEAGFSDYKITPTSGYLSVIEVYA